MKSLTLLDCLAHGDIVTAAKAEDKIACCWLVTDEKIKEEGRAKILKMFNDKLLPAGVVFFPLTEETFDEKVFSILPTVRPMYTDWVRAEEEFRKAREAGNPRAFFVA
jgi:hypothetical protein